MGLGLLIITMLYLLITIVVVAGAIAYARRSGRSAQRWGLSAVLGMYLLVFWDYIPTMLVHKYYCATESGFWVYKTLEQWKLENPGVFETLVHNKSDPSIDRGDMNNFQIRHLWNTRFNSLLAKSGPFAIRRWRWEQQVVDVTTGEVLARRIEFSTGNGKVGGEPELRFWLHTDGCTGYENRALAFVDFAKKFRGAEH